MVQTTGGLVSGFISRVLLALVLALSTLAGGAVAADAAGSAREALVSTSPGVTGGTPVPGSYVSAELGEWKAPGPSDYAFQWLRDGVAIAGATERDYLVQPADVGHRLEPVVTGSRPGYESASATGSAVTARKLAATVTLEVRKVRKPGGDDAKRAVKRIWVAITTVQAERPWPIAGSVEAYEGKPSNAVGSSPVTRDTAVVKVPWRYVRRGKHTIGACYSGSDAIAAACAPTATIDERRR